MEAYLYPGATGNLLNQNLSQLQFNDECEKAIDPTNRILSDLRRERFFTSWSTP